MEKSDIRREVRQRIKALSPEERMAEARSIFDRVEALDSFGKAQCVAAFVAMPDEVPTKEILGRWLKLGKRIVVPRVEGDIMRFYDYSPDRIVVGAYGIEEPQGNDEVAPREIDLIIVPARAFTLAGARLGRGGGFYDKYMSLEGFRAYKVGVAFRCQIFDELPTDKHDIGVDMVVAGV
ncbi:MAG: 5-formyltetrahydrofolate cyclo-ligase [Alistipes sp.]|nr:5-formyltetrahydrofolate cyclo-ligase [Alistipes sp.]